jgi:hypothetical protein
MLTLALGAAWPVDAQRPPAPPAVDDLVRAAASYVARYQRDFQFLLADEHADQIRTVEGHPAREARAMRGELFLTYLAADRRWIAIHDVADVDGVPVPDRDDLRALLRQSAAGAVARRLAARNARYNLGRVIRNFNEPTLALQVFSEDRHRQFRFAREAVSQEAGVTLVTVGFRERDRPTLVSSVRGGAVYSTGEAHLEVATGRIHRSRIRFEDGPVVATLDTTFAANADVGLWVPVRFTERYELDDDGGRETIVGDARYTNYRRFETSGRLRLE